MFSITYSPWNQILFTERMMQILCTKINKYKKKLSHLKTVRQSSRMNDEWMKQKLINTKKLSYLKRQGCFINEGEYFGFNISKLKSMYLKANCRTEACLEYRLDDVQIMNYWVVFIETIDTEDIEETNTHPKAHDF